MFKHQFRLLSEYLLHLNHRIVCHHDNVLTLASNTTEIVILWAHLDYANAPSIVNPLLNFADWAFNPNISFHSPTTKIIGRNSKMRFQFHIIPPKIHGLRVILKQCLSINLLNIIKKSREFFVISI